ncbi:hypothetical protein Mapa_000398 [Marchantia paleacea]|nr:hypothetical protein Mapa_000398 [Marchantia paleacea]
MMELMTMPDVPCKLTLDVRPVIDKIKRDVATAQGHMQKERSNQDRHVLNQARTDQAGQWENERGF